MEKLHSLISWANPSPKDRLPLDLSNLYILTLPFPVLLLQVHLLLRHKLNRLNHLIRFLCIFPAALLSSRAGFAHRFKLDDEVGGTLQCYNVALGIYVAFAILKSVEWGLLNERPRLRGKKTKKEDGSKKIIENGDTSGHSPSRNGHTTSTLKYREDNTSELKSRSNGKAARNSNSSPSLKTDLLTSTSTQPLPLFFPGSWVPLELDYLSSMRGLGWEFGIESPAGYNRKTWTAEQRMRFVFGRIGNSLIGIVLMDFLDCVMKHSKINPASRSGGGSLWESQEGVLGSAGPPFLTILLGFVVYAAIQGAYSLLSVICVGLIRSSPDYWTPLPFSTPWSATSLRKLWAHHWHALFRRSFLILAYFPIRTSTNSKLLGVVGTFILSGLLHEVGQWTMIRSPPFDQDRMWGRTTLFFFLQGVGTVLEEGWEVMSGRKVGFFGGWLWTYGWMTVTGMLASDVWFRLGMSNSYASLRFTRPLVDSLVLMLEKLS